MNTGTLATQLYNFLSIPKRASMIQQFGSDLIVGISINGEWLHESYTVQPGDILSEVQEKLNQLATNLTQHELCA